MKKLKYLWKNHRRLLLGFSLASLLTLAFLLKFVFSVVYFSNHRDASIEPWMPIGYIARSYRVDRGWLALQTGLPESYFRSSESIKDAAKEAGTSFEAMRAKLLAAIKAERAQ